MHACMHILFVFFIPGPIEITQACHDMEMVLEDILGERARAAFMHIYVCHAYICICMQSSSSRKWYWIWWSEKKQSE